MNIKTLLSQRQHELESMAAAMNDGDSIKAANHAGAVRALESVIHQERNTTVQVIEKTVHHMWPHQPGRAQRVAVGQIRSYEKRTGYADSGIGEVTA